MSALAAGISAPDFKLSGIDGKQFSLGDALTRGPVLLAFFKVSCPVCQFALPVVEKIYQVYGSEKVSIVGISQNNKRDTNAFMQEFGVAFPVLLDDTSTYLVSNSYGLTNVPTIFWIGRDGDIDISSVGWIKKDVEEINRQVAGLASKAAKPLFEPGQPVAEFRAG